MPPAKIRVFLQREDEARIRLVVEDDGVGFDIAGPPQGSGLGTRIVKAMAANLKTEIHFDPAHTGTRAIVSFAIPQESAGTGARVKRRRLETFPIPAARRGAPRERG